MLFLGLALLAATLAGVEASTTVVSASASASAISTYPPHHGWHLGGITVTGILFLFPLFLFLIALLTWAFVYTSEFAKCDVDDCDRQFFRYITILWVSVAIFTYLWMIFALAWSPIYFGFAGAGANFVLFLIVHLFVLGGMIWFLVYIINKARHLRVSSGGSACGTKKKCGKCGHTKCKCKKNESSDESD